jgi:hypothetical protein
MLLTGEFAAEGEMDDTEDDLFEKAEAKVELWLWEVVRNGMRDEHYYFTDETGEGYRFNISDRTCCNPIATSFESDFNSSVASHIMGVGKVRGIKANGTINHFNVISAVDQGPNVEIEVSQNINSSHFQTIVLRETFRFTANKENRTFTIKNEDLTAKLSEGDSIRVARSQSNDGDYTITLISFDGTDTEIKVDEVVRADETSAGKYLFYRKTFDVVEVKRGTGENSFVIPGGAGDIAVQQMIEFFTKKFFSKEGMHIVEHTLLRPKICGHDLISVENATGISTGSLTLTKKANIVAADSSSNSFEAEGNISTDLNSTGTTITVSETSGNNGEYEVVNASDSGGNTIIEVADVAEDILATEAEGIVSYSRTFEIDEVSADDGSFTIDTEGDGISTYLNPGDSFEVHGSQYEQNNGGYRVSEVIINSADSASIKLEPPEDNFLSIQTDSECGVCDITDPYSCIVSVFLPFWTGRFPNQDFKRFVERTLRKEAPAHLLLNICWLDCEQMNEFENKYKAWILENSKAIKDETKLSDSLNALTDIIGRIRNVYPTATLHSCKEEDALQNAVVLGHTFIGNA